MTEPSPGSTRVTEARKHSLSSDVKSMLHDEHSQRLEAIESTLSQWQATVWAKQIERRMAVLEELCAGCKEANELIESMPLPWGDSD